MKDDDPARVEEINLNQEIIAQFIKFEVLTWYGHGGGLQFFQVVSTSSSITSQGKLLFS